MRHRSKLLLSALTATFILAAAISTANARRLQVNENRFLITWTEPNKLNFFGTGQEIACPVTLLGSFHSRTIEKISGRLIGLVTSAALTKTGTECTKGGAAQDIIILNGIETDPRTGRLTTSSLPWRILYVSFRGTLPRIEAIRLSLRDIGVLLRAAEQFCLYKATEAAQALGETAVDPVTGAATGITPDERAGIPLFEGSRLLCPSRGFFRGRGNVHAGKTTELLLITLVQ